MPYSRERKEYFRNLAREIRLAVLKMIYEAGSGHPGGSLSAVEIIATLYFDKMRVDPRNPNWENRDRFIPSKGHCAPALYAVFAEKEYFPKSELNTFRCFNSILQGHPDLLKTPGVDMSTGSLGHGPSVGLGMALAGRLSKKDFYVYVLSRLRRDERRRRYGRPPWRQQSLSSIISSLFLIITATNSMGPWTTSCLSGMSRPSGDPLAGM